MTAMVDLEALPEALRGGTVAIGNFDGVHRGHQTVLSAALGGPGPAVALTFEPHPRAYFSGKPIFRLTPAPQKAARIAALGLHGTVVGRFDASFAALSADEFIAVVLQEKLGAQRIVIGEDFKFGKGRTGRADLLRTIPGLDVTIIPPLLDDGGVAVSSSRIREALGAGDLDSAHQWLGYRYQVAAPIIHGEKRGRDLGYPTANQALAAENALRHGVYAVRAKVGGVWRDGVASFGRRPMFDNGAPLLETFIFDFSGDLYGKSVPVTLVRFLRPEMTFDGLDALVTQMDADSATARDILTGMTPLSPLDEAVNFV